MNQPPTESVPIRGESIDLDQLLKKVGVVGSGGAVKALLEEQLVTVNGELESRRRRTLRPGDVVALHGSGSWRITSE
jgi:ribosome-associated protein